VKFERNGSRHKLFSVAYNNKQLRIKKDNKLCNVRQNKQQVVRQKYVCSQKGGGFVWCRYFVDEEEVGFFRIRRPRFFAQIASDFSKFMMCPHGQRDRELSQSGHFANKGEESLFYSILCRRLLCTAPK